MSYAYQVTQIPQGAPTFDGGKMQIHEKTPEKLNYKIHTTYLHKNKLRKIKKRHR